MRLVHDRWLLDWHDARHEHALATQPRSTPSGSMLDLPRSAVEMFEWDSVDRIYDGCTPRGTRIDVVFPA